MLGHRMLTTEDYLTILRRRGWIVAIPALILPLIAVGITFLIPAQYISQTLVLVEQQKVPDDYVKPVISEDLNGRLASMKEQIMSRSSLQPIIERFNLYGTQKMTMDDRIDQTRKSIDIKPIHSEIARTGGLPGFFISFKAADARTAQAVCGEITSLFVSQNLRDREQSAQGTTAFLRQQLADAKRNLDEQDSKLATFQQTYVGRLPGQEDSNMNMLTSLNTQLDAATQALGRMEQDKSYEEAMLAQQSRDLQIPEQQRALPAAQNTELQQLEAQETDLTSRYTPDYPDVVTVKRKIRELQTQMAKAPAAPAASSTASVQTRVEPASVQQLRAQLRALDQGITAKRHDQAMISGQVRMYQDRIQSSPLVQEQYKNMTRDYETAQQFYGELLKKMNQSKMATDLERRQQGEQFRVMDEPNLPDAPYFPKRIIFAGGGLAAGLLLGLALIAGLEYRDTALRSERDIWAFTKLPTLGVIAYATPTEVDTKSGVIAKVLRRRPKTHVPGEPLISAGG
jgi:polysaccharide chain length determinant protein (PEP-CTERM system associated)